MLKLCVIFLLIALSSWAASDDDAAALPSATPNCIEQMLASLKAEIVEMVPEMREEMRWLREQVALLEAGDLIKRDDLVHLSERLLLLESRVRGLHWAPPNLPEHLLTPRHFTVREASHDLKNALLVARIDADEIREAATEDEKRLILQSVKINFELAEELIETIENPTTSRKRIVSVRELFRDLEVLLQALPNKVVLSTVRPGVGLAVRASRTDLLRIAQNLVLNAAEAMPNGGTIKLSADRIDSPDARLDVEPPPENTPEVAALLKDDSTVVVRAGQVAKIDKQSYLSIKVADNGPGMSKKVLSSIFGATNSTKTPGDEDVNPRGVGLASVMTLAVANNGIVEANSEEGEGTEIQAMFPLVDRKITEQMEQEINVPSTPGQIVLIDDERSMRVLISTLIKSKGIPVVTFSNSLSALEFCRLHKQDIRLVLIDQYLTDGSSMEANVDDLLAEGVTAPIVASSANETPFDVKVTTSFPKPFAIEPFMELLEKYAPLKKP